jgi:hypothetical protein
MSTTETKKPSTHLMGYVSCQAGKDVYHYSFWQSVFVAGSGLGIVNYMTFRGLVKYGFDSDARSLAENTITLFGRDLERFGALHEYYQPENGEPILNRGFQNWNFLVLNMIAWLEERPVVTEF